jgi:hypothetical protein
VIWNLKHSESDDIHVRVPLLTCELRTAVKAESGSEQPQAKETDDTELDLKAAEENKVCLYVQ